MYMWFNRPWNIIYFGALNSCEESTLSIPHRNQKLMVIQSKVLLLEGDFFKEEQQNQQQILLKLQ